MDSGPSIAIAHDYLTQRGGAERVVLAMARAFPGARIYTTLYHPEGTYPEFADLDIVVTPLNKVPFLRRRHRLALPLLAGASSRVEIEEDVVVVSSSGWAHGFQTRGPKLVYCHSPARWLYLTDEYVGTGPRARLKSAAVKALRAPLERWDHRAASQADRYLANSTVIRQRIADVYGIDADVLPPPHGVSPEGDRDEIPGIVDWAPDGYHLVVSRLLPYKNVDQVVAAFAQLPQDRLLVVGAGPLREELAAVATPNVRFVQDLSDAQMRWAYAGATALIAPSREDFGLTPLEAGAFGKPVLALRAGGYLDTVREGQTGLFFDAAVPGDIRAAVGAARDRGWDADLIRAHVHTFAEPRFRALLRGAVADLLPADLQVAFRNRWDDSSTHKEAP
ncbi:glycosyltransferase [Ornithinimicrobium cryptoxanthini]|uniref:D-inositol 3-phosphate glycosyltransferase n=1 Tax=Ornithinimicrobium cryptoxanthini TaxID=2934161 RepID=A0ABY4YJS2_9MICO|nr:glycosyltransferase [Ornithinimicrobium cryptoxanthini]USQ76578.1 glycosyltransferase [Ornithinimicrobium cryptoxanthini]